MNKLTWSPTSENTWKASISADIFFVITRVRDGFKLNLESPIIDSSNDFHEVFDTQTEAAMRAEEMFEGLEKLFR
jgi:hypothetical protein